MNTRHLLRKIRTDHKKSQESVAFAMGISTNSYKKLESGPTKIRLDHLERFGKVFNLSLELLLQSNPEPESNMKKTDLSPTIMQHLQDAAEQVNRTFL